MRFSQPVDKSCSDLLDVSSLSRIYQRYFPLTFQKFQMRKSTTNTESVIENALFAFLKDFDICPTLVTKGSAYQLFNHIRNHDEQDLRLRCT